MHHQADTCYAASTTPNLHANFPGSAAGSTTASATGQPGEASAVVSAAIWPCSAPAYTDSATISAGTWSPKHLRDTCWQGRQPQPATIGAVREHIRQNGSPSAFQGALATAEDIDIRTALADRAAPRRRTANGERHRPSPARHRTTRCGWRTGQIGTWLARGRTGSAGVPRGERRRDPEHVGILLQAAADVAAAGHRPAADPGARPSPGASCRAPRFVHPNSEGAAPGRLGGHRRIPAGGP